MAPAGGHDLPNSANDGQQIAPGLTFVPGKPWRIVAENIGVLRAVFGDELLAAFARCFSAADRMMTIYDCILLNEAHCEERSVRRLRNLNVLGFFSVGLVVEFQEGIQALEDAGIESRLTSAGAERLARLRRFRELESESALKAVRNQAAFHLGLQETALRGIERLASDGRPAVLMSGDGQSKVEGRHDVGIEIMLAGINARPRGVPKGTPNSNQRLEIEEMKGALAEAHTAHDAVIEWLDDLLVDVLHNAGIGTSALQPLGAEVLPA